MEILISLSLWEKAYLIRITVVKCVLGECNMPGTTGISQFSAKCLDDPMQYVFYHYYPHCTHEENEAQNNKVTCLWSSELKMVESLECTALYFVAIPLLPISDQFCSFWHPIRKIFNLSVILLAKNCFPHTLPSSL